MAKMKIISWNMGGGFSGSGYRPRQPTALAWLREQSASVLLLQEVVLSGIRTFDGMLVHSLPTSPGQPTGNALLVRTEQLEPVDIRIPGALVAAGRARLRGEEFLVVSAHVLTNERHPEAQKAVLAAFVQQARGLVDERCILGGDFNASLNWPHYRGDFFEPMRRAGFVDTRPHPEEVQSYWGKGSAAVIQDDHVFTDPDTARCVRFWAVISNDEHRAWSDHGPVVVEMGETTT